MTTIEIKVLLLRRQLTIGDLASEFGCRREELSMCIRQVRVYTELREKLAAKLGLSVDQLFGEVMKRSKVAKVS
jgi:hypothetical protein